MIKLRQYSTVRRLASERGQSLVLAIIVLLVLTISAGAVAQLMTSNQNLSNTERQGVQAFSGGEAGLSVAANQVVTQDAGNTQAVGTVLTNTTTVAGNTVVWKATKTSASQWKVGTVTKSPNGKVTRVLQQQMESITIPGVPATIWGYGIVMGGASAPVSNGGAICSTSPQPSTTTRFTGSATITVPTWITTDVCIVGGANPAMGNPPTCTPPAVAPCPIAVHIGGALAVSGPDYAIGKPTNKVASASINNGCWATPGSWTLLGGCDLNQNKNANDNPLAGSGVQALDYHPVDPSPTPVKPTLDSATETQKWLNASPGPKHPCTTGSAPANFFDNNAGSTSAPDTSLSPGGVPKELTTLLGASAFDCQTATGEIKWTPGGSGINGTLYLTGTVFIDASITMTGGNELIKLAPDSDGSLYIDGYFSMFNSASLCGYISGGGCNPTTDGWNPNVNAHDPLIFLSAFNRSNHVPGFDLNGNSNFEGVGYTNGEFNLANSAQIGGSVFADYGLFTGSGNFIVTNVAPVGSLGSVTTTTSWAIAPRTWRQCPVTGCT